MSGITLSACFAFEPEDEEKDDEEEDKTEDDDEVHLGWSEREIISSG